MQYEKLHLNYYHMEIILYSANASGHSEYHGHFYEFKHIMKYNYKSPTL